MRIGWVKGLRVALAMAAPLGAAGAVAACGDMGYYDGPAYVIGHYTCVNPNSGQLDYCVEYSDGTSSLVPYDIYSTVLYGQVLTVSHSVWAVHPAVGIHVHAVADVYHVHYRAASVYPNMATAQRAASARSASSSGGTVYGGGSYKSKSGQVVYRSPTGKAYSSSGYSGSSSSSRTVYRSSGYSGRH